MNLDKFTFPTFFIKKKDEGGNDHYSEVVYVKKDGKYINVIWDIGVGTGYPVIIHNYNNRIYGCEIFKDIYYPINRLVKLEKRTLIRSIFINENEESIKR